MTRGEVVLVAGFIAGERHGDNVGVGWLLHVLDEAACPAIAIWVCRRARLNGKKVGLLPDLQPDRPHRFPILQVALDRKPCDGRGQSCRQLGLRPVLSVLALYVIWTGARVTT